MIIETELDTEKNELFILIKDRMNNIELMEKMISNYINENINIKFKIYLFLCDNAWNKNSRKNCYRGLWKQQSVKEKFGKYSNAGENKIVNKESGGVMFATYFNLDDADLYLGVSENASLLSGHSFVFLSEKEPEFDIQDLFDSLYLSGNNWKTLIETLHRYQCIPVQRWEGGNELSLRFFLYDDVINEVSRLCK